MGLEHPCEIFIISFFFICPLDKVFHELILFLQQFFEKKQFDWL